MNQQQQPEQKPKPTPKRRRFLPIPALTEKEQERFEAFIDRTPGQGPNGDCWRWKGATTGEGYPSFVMRGHTYHSHRVSLRQKLGRDFPTKLCMHKCDETWCINPAHLKPGTAKQNHADMMRKGRWKPPARKAASIDGQTNRTNPNAPDARPARNNQNRPDGQRPNRG